jgi:hypothetical protein
VNPDLHDPIAIRAAGRDLLSLALIDARNHTLRWLAAFEAAPHPQALRLAGHVGWFQEHAIGRNVQRARGALADATAPRLASIEPHADRWWREFEGDAPNDLPGLDGTRHYLVETLETTLELLAAAPDGDDALHAFRLALEHEDRCGERLPELAQALPLSAQAQRMLWPPLPARVAREPIGFAGAARPDFEIDAQAVSWAQYLEFVHDGGYDEPAWWSDEGWCWAEREGRRGPRYVEQLSEGVLVQRQGQLQRVSSAQPVLHVAWHEAAAWCRWAGRRLPSVDEWTLAASDGRGFIYGDVWEWVAGRDGAQRTQCGGSWLTSPRLKQPGLRRLAAAEDDLGFTGFRSCAS